MQRKKLHLGCAQSGKRRSRRQPTSAALGDLTALSEALHDAATAGAQKLEARRRKPPKGLGRGAVAARKRIMCDGVRGHMQCWGAMPPAANLQVYPGWGLLC